MNGSITRLLVTYKTFTSATKTNGVQAIEQHTKISAFSQPQNIHSEVAVVLTVLRPLSLGELQDLYNEQKHQHIKA